MVSSYCRLCANLTPEYDLIDILDSKNELEYKIQQCLHLEINTSDMLPKQTCSQCEAKLILYYNFYDQVTKAQVVLQTEIEPLEFPKEEYHTDEDEVLYPKTELVSELSENENEVGDANDATWLNKSESPEIENNTEIIRRDKKYTRCKRFKFKPETSEELEEMKEEFYKQLNVYNTKNIRIITDQAYERLIKEVEDAEKKIKKGIMDQRRLAKFEIYIDNDKKKLIVPRTKNSHIQYFIPKSELFKEIHNAHLECSHGGRTRTENILKHKFKNITRELVTIYISVCKVCKSRPKTMRERISFQNAVKKMETEKKIQNEKASYEWKCKECNDLLPSPKDLSDHFDTVHKKPVEYICLECSKIYTSYIPFRTHVFKHRNRFRYRCEICNNFYSSAGKLRYHKERHNKTRQKHFCPTCGKGFLDEYYLTKHERQKHSSNVEENKELPRPFECDECHKMFAALSSLNTHKKVHTGIREHICEHCGKSFVHKPYLEDHMASHRDERPFKCSICPASFKWKKHLRRHELLHTGLKPYECEICGNKFARKSALNRHSLTHTDIYPFKCDLCEKRFRYKKNLVKHRSSHPWENI